MGERKLSDLEEFLKHEMLLLNINNFTIKKGSKRFNLPKDVVKNSYLKVRSMIIKEAINRRGLVYLLLSSIFLFVGIKSIQGNSEYIYLGGILFGSAGILTAVGYFILAIKGNSN